MPAGKRYKKLFFAIGASDTGKAFLKITTLKKLINGCVYNRPPVTVTLLIPFRIYFRELIEIITNKFEEW